MAAKILKEVGKDNKDYNKRIIGNRGKYGSETKRKANFGLKLGEIITEKKCCYYD